MKVNTFTAFNHVFLQWQLSDLQFLLIYCVPDIFIFEIAQLRFNHHVPNQGMDPLLFWFFKGRVKCISDSASVDGDDPLFRTNVPELERPATFGF